MIIEDYCSFETALLLKEKGFDAEIKTYWWKGPHDEPINFKEGGSNKGYHPLCIEFLQ